MGEREAIVITDIPYALFMYPGWWEKLPVLSTDWKELFSVKDCLQPPLFSDNELTVIMSVSQNTEKSLQFGFQIVLESHASPSIRGQ